MAGDHVTTRSPGSYNSTPTAETSPPGCAGHAVAASRSSPSSATASTTALATRIANGLPDAEAAQAAIAEDFGTPDVVADAFAGELATAYASAPVALFVLTGPLVGIWWLRLLQPHPWQAGLGAIILAIPVLPLIPIAIAAAATALATTGRPS